LQLIAACVNFSLLQSVAVCCSRRERWQLTSEIRHPYMRRSTLFMCKRAPPLHTPPRTYARAHTHTHTCIHIYIHQMSQYGGGGGLFGSPLRRQDTSGQVAALQQRCSHLEIERDKLADQLALLSAQSRTALQDELMVSCSVLQCRAVSCSVLQCLAVSCSFV